jgi:hypothetical protein
MRNPHAPADLVHAFRLARTKCGDTVARASWGFYVWFPTGANLFSSGYLVLSAKTPEGWRIYSVRNIS